MQRDKQRQIINTADPVVAAFIAECGISAGPVSIRLVGQTEEDVMVQVRRLERAFGDNVRMTRASLNMQRSEWIAYGTILA